MFLVFGPTVTRKPNHEEHRPSDARSFSCGSFFQRHQVFFPVGTEQGLVALEFLGRRKGAYGIRHFLHMHSCPVIQRVGGSALSVRGLQPVQHCP